MKSFTYKNYLTPSLIKESSMDEDHNQTIYDFLTTMRYGSLPLVNTDDILIQQDEVHTSLFVQTNSNFIINTQTIKSEYIPLEQSYKVYTLTYDSNHTECSFDIEDYQSSEPLQYTSTIKYKDIEEYCLNLINQLNLFRNKKTNNKSKENTTNAQNGNLTQSLINQKYTKSTRLEDIDITQSNDNTPVQNPNFKKKVEVRFTVQDMIGDNLFRNITDTKQKAEGSVINWHKQYQQTIQQEDEYTLTCDILNHLIESPSNTISLSKDFLDSKYDLDISKINLHEVSKLLSVWPVELLSPLIFLNLDDSVNWGESKNTLKTIFGNENIFKNGLISYNNSSEELIDSEVAIKNENGKYRKIGLSSKGGLNGKGANASLVSIFKLLFNKEITEYTSDIKKEKRYMYSNTLRSLIKSKNIVDNIKSFIQEKCSDYANKNLMGAYPIQTCLIILFGGIQPKYHKEVIENIYNNGLFPKNTLPKLESLSDFCNFINTKHQLTDPIINLLNNQKFDFAQLNAKPFIDNNSFKYQWSVQYPANFDGVVKLEPGSVGVKFHIVG